MDAVKLELEFELSEAVGPASKDSLIAQLTEVIAAAIEERQLEIPDADITDYRVGCDEF